MTFLKKLRFKLFVTTLATLICVPFAASAQTPQQWFQSVINNIINFIVWPIFAALVVIMFIWAGFLFLTAQGDPSRIDQARKTLIWAIVGVVIGLLAFFAANTIRSLLGL